MKVARAVWTYTKSERIVRYGEDPDNWEEAADIGWYEEASNEFEISTAEELAGLASLVNSGEEDFSGKTIILSGDIDLKNIEWTPIGYIDEDTDLTADEYSYENVFRGSFDGNGHTISNLKIDKSEAKAVGLFGVIDLDVDGEIKDVKIENADINGFTGVGALAGMVRSGETWQSGIGFAAQISGIQVSNSTITGLKYVGGIIGYSTASIKNCEVSGINVESNYVEGMEGRSGETAGGIVGNLYDLYSISNCIVSDATIKSQTRAGGIAGSSRYAKDISNCTIDELIIELVKAENPDAENEGYAGYVSGRASQDTINASSGNVVTNSIANIYDDYEVEYFYKK